MAVHPRRRGEHSSFSRYAALARGSSPQARGTLHHVNRRRAQARFIPAGAGNTPAPAAFLPRPAVHPRRRGEHCCGRCRTAGYPGSSPQARGTQQIERYGSRHDRFIPAGAGNTCGVRRRLVMVPVHPRRRGEHVNCIVKICMRGGSSPQARGTHAIHLVVTRQFRFIPAGAGNTARYLPLDGASAVHPRRRGEHDSRAISSPIRRGSSPQARGTHAIGVPVVPNGRFIPAGAGNTGN